MTCEISRAPRKKWLHIAFFATAAFSLLTKETAVLSYGLCGLWLCGVMLVRQHSWNCAAAIIGGGFVSVSVAVSVAVVPALQMKLGSDYRLAFSALETFIRHRSDPGNWAELYCSGPWYLRVISPANGTYCLLAGLGLWYLLSQAQTAFSIPVFRAVIVAAITILAWSSIRDYRAYTFTVVGSGMEELAVSDIRYVMNR